MKELLAEHTSLAAALLGLAVLTLLVLMFANALRRSARKRAGTPLAKPSAHAAPVQKVKLDPAVLVAIEKVNGPARTAPIQSFSEVSFGARYAEKRNTTTTAPL